MFVWIRPQAPEYAQCPSAPRLGTLGAMIHATQNARHRTRRALTLLNQRLQAIDGERPGLRASLPEMRGALSNAAGVQRLRSAACVQEGKQP